MFSVPSFLELPAFTRGWAAAGFGDDDLLRLQAELAADPAAGAVIRGTGGLRKVRFAPPGGGGGKRGGVRVLYAHFPGVGVILLAAVYGKSDRANISPAERAAAKRALAEIAAELSRPRRPEEDR